MTPPRALLTPELLRRLEQLQLLAARRTKGSIKGERRSRSRGQSVEFADFRNYVPGDDLRYLDWNLFGRLDRLFLKLYEEERELPVRIFLDVSESMKFGEPTKFEFARQIAAAVGHVALCGFDRVQLSCLPESGADAECQAGLRSVRGKRSSLRFLSHLSRIQPGGQAFLNSTLKRGAMESRQTGVALVISDFLDPAGYEEGLKALVVRGFQTHLIQVLSSEEMEPTTYGDLRMIDSESGAVQEVSFGKFRLKSYRQSVENYIQRLREFCHQRGIGFYSTTSNTSVDQLLLRHLRETSLWG